GAPRPFRTGVRWREPERFDRGPRSQNFGPGQRAIAVDIQLQGLVQIADVEIPLRVHDGLTLCSQGEEAAAGRLRKRAYVCEEQHDGGKQLPHREAPSRASRRTSW